MVYCENEKCVYKWLHIDCIGMDKDDIPEGDFFCSQQCEKEHKAPSGRSSVAGHFIDYRREYAFNLIWRGLNDLVRNDAIRENDGPRIIRNWKLDIIELCENHHPKYVIYAARLLLLVSGGASERMTKELIWNRTVNSHDGIGQNIPKDLHMEHLNRKYKENSKSSAGQLTEATIQRHSQLAALEENFFQYYNKDFLNTNFQDYSKRSSENREKDFKDLVKALNKEKIFNFKSGRPCPGFPNICHSLKVKKPMELKLKLLKVRSVLATKREQEHFLRKVEKNKLVSSSNMQ